MAIVSAPHNQKEKSMDFIELPPGHVPVGRRKPGLIVVLRQKMAKLREEKARVANSLLLSCEASTFPAAVKDELIIILAQLVASGKAEAYYPVTGDQASAYGGRCSTKSLLRRWTRIKNDWSRSVKIEILEEGGGITVHLTAI